ncbi:MAG: YwmB family TATA-box binding protein [Bacillota bacterium]
MQKKLVKYSYFFILLIILFTIGYIRLYYREGSSLETLQKAFKASGAELLSSETYLWGEVGKEYGSFDDLAKLADKFAEEMGIVKNDLYSRRLISNDSIDKIEIIGSSYESDVINICAQLSREQGKLKQSYITASVTVESPELRLEKTAETLLGVFEKYDIKPKINTCITGYFSGKLDYDALNKASKQIFNNARAKKINGITDRNLISVSAYSPIIDNTISVDGKKVNMNLAIRYNSYENKTYIWLATPVITVEY